MATHGRSGVNSLKGESVFSSIRKYVKRLFIRKYRGFWWAQWLDIGLAMQGTLADSLVYDSTAGQLSLCAATLNTL